MMQKDIQEISLGVSLQKQDRRYSPVVEYLPSMYHKNILSLSQKQKIYKIMSNNIPYPSI
jgi:hypothetical protein